MRTVELTPRLRSVAELVPRGARFADVGTDHAYLPVWLLQQGRITGAVASDLRPGPLERARGTAEKYGLTGRMDFSLCDGLSGIQPDEVNTIAIAGMGGETIVDLGAGMPASAPAHERPALPAPLASGPRLYHPTGAAEPGGGHPFHNL